MTIKIVQGKGWIRFRPFFVPVLDSTHIVWLLHKCEDIQIAVGIDKSVHQPFLMSCQY